MAKEIMRRTAADNEYLHKDFHGALSNGIEYLDKTYGPDAVAEYLREFTLEYYAPLRKEIMRRGLVALRDHFASIYATEKAEVELELTDDQLVVRVPACPAVTYMRSKNQPVARLYSETSRAVNEVLCEGTPYLAELVSYREEDGASVQLFRRKT